MKQKLKKILIYFFVFMIAANLICRIRDTYMIPRVIVKNPIRTVLTHSLQAEGYFYSDDERYIQPEAGWKIGKVYVEPGNQVEEQDILWQYDVTYLQELCMEKKQTLEKKQIEMQQIKLTYETENGITGETIASQSLERATEQVAFEQIWLEEAVAEYEKKIASINRKYDKQEDLARQEYNIACSEELEDTQKALLDTKLASQIENLKEARKQEKESAYENVVSQNKSLFQSIQDYDKAKQSYDNAVITLQEEQVKQAHRNQSVSLSLALLEIEEKKLKDDLEYIEECINQEGYVYTNKSGNVTKVELTEGHLASGEEKVEVTGVSNRFVFNLPEDNVAILKKGDTCFIRVAGMAKSMEGEILALQPETDGKEGSWTITCIQTGEEDWEECRWKQQGTVTIQKKTQEYDCCIPVEALVCQNGAYYCRVVTQEQTILGIEEMIEEVPVVVIDKDTTYAYVTGDINEESKIVTDYNKFITNRDRVRVVSRI